MSITCAVPSGSAQANSRSAMPQISRLSKRSGKRKRLRNFDGIYASASVVVATLIVRHILITLAKRYLKALRSLIGRVLTAFKRNQ
jgi:hypothetical protein